MIDWIKTEQEFNINQTNYKFNSTVVVICDGCGTSSHKKIRSKKNIINEQMAWKCMSCCLDNPSTKLKKSNNSKKMWAKNRDKIINSIDYSKISEKAKKNWQNDKYRSKVVKTIKENAPNHSKRMKEKWQDPNYRNKMMAIYHTKEWSESRSKIANHAWKDEDYKNCILEHNKKKRITKNQFLSRAKEKYGDRYDYSEINYVSYNDNIKIICKKHGEFWQIPRFHVKSGCGCPVCAGTHLQAEIYEFINNLEDNIVNNDRKIIKPNELDILVEDKSLAFEINGMYWHSFNHVESTKERNKHVHKLNLCIDKKIKLIQITEYEWLDKKDIIKSIIKSKLGASNRIYARKCKICKLETPEYRKFITQNHLQGYNHSHAVYGLKYKNELIAVMSFNKHKKYGWEITRFANRLDTTVVGGASRLFKKFIKEHNPSFIMTYADRRYSDGNLYKILGFELVKTTKPNYVYIKGSNYYSRQQFMKYKLRDKLKTFDSNLTEAENMFNNGYRRMWDAGNYKFLWSKIQK